MRQVQAGLRAPRRDGAGVAAQRQLALKQPAFLSTEHKRHCAEGCRARRSGPALCRRCASCACCACCRVWCRAAVTCCRCAPCCAARWQQGRYGCRKPSQQLRDRRMHGATTASTPCEADAAWRKKERRPLVEEETGNSMKRGAFRSATSYSRSYPCTILSKAPSRAAITPVLFARTSLRHPPLASSPAAAHIDSFPTSAVGEGICHAGHDLHAVQQRRERRGFGGLATAWIAAWVYNHHIVRLQGISEAGKGWQHTREQRRSVVGRQNCSCIAHSATSPPCRLTSKFSATRSTAPMLAGVLGDTSTIRMPLSRSGSSAAAAAAAAGAAAAAAGDSGSVAAAAQRVKRKCLCTGVLLGWLGARGSGCSARGNLACAPAGAAARCTAVLDIGITAAP